MQVSRAAVALIFSADAFAGTKTSQVVDRAMYGRRLVFVIVHKGNTGRYTVTVEACKPDGSDPVAVPFEYQIATGANDTFAARVAATAAGFTVPAAANQTIVLRAYKDEDPNGDRVGLRVKTVETVDDPVLGGIVAYCADPVQCGDDVVAMLLN